MRARLHVQADRIGFYLEGTHTLCAPASTHQLQPETLVVLDATGHCPNLSAPEETTAAIRAFL